eukprot:GILI01010640.1.p1 GENE.GILI01010640.1~~GILI01010640.1.p1  ORF type:complete len:426 (-),score=162.44 GILI01010640.1:292-1569(-)
MFTRFSSRSAVAMPRMAAGTQVRALNVHEYSAKRILNDFGVKTEYGIMCQTIAEVETAVAKIKSDKKVVKSQILAGGRGKGTFVDGFQGGVHVCANADTAIATAKKMLGNTLVTKQTGPKGAKVERLFVTEAIPNIKRELYVALVLDRKSASPIFIASQEGGMGIEELAHSQPDKIKKLQVNVHNGVDEAAAIKFAEELGFQDARAESVAGVLKNLYNLAKSKDCTMVEINPMVELEDGTVLCIDAKLSFDDNAQFRQDDVWQEKDEASEDAKELAAEKAGLGAYISLDGNVGCMVNGAGLAMATMDVISKYGGTPANFLDVGGSAKAEQIVKAFEIITSDKNVKCIFVNIFGGIMKCDVIAAGVIEAVQHLGDKLKVPIVVRLKGTNEQEGKALLEKSGLRVYPAEHIDDAAKKAVELTKAGHN